jgi:hypothetical protein
MNSRFLAPECVTKAVTIFGFLLATVPASAPAQAVGINAWASGLKCSSLVTGDAKKILPDFGRFIYWFDGFIAGISSVEPINLVKMDKDGKLSAVVLAACATKQDSLAVEQTLDFSALMLHLNPNVNPPHLKNPFGENGGP